MVRIPSVKFTTTPENVMKYAEFMHRVGIDQERVRARGKTCFFPRSMNRQEADAGRC